MQTGIVGLPNVGKSTLFNALTRTRRAEAENYPFCTIEPNVGVVIVPDARLEPLAKLVKTETIIPAAIEIVDIAGLVAGASKGEGLGNQFLANIRDVDAVIHVVRCFEDEDVSHSMGGIDALRDIEVVSTELILADIQSCEAQLDRNQRRAKGQDKEALANAELIGRVILHLNESRPAFTMELSEDEWARMRSFCLLTAKPVVYACNVLDSDIADPSQNPHVARVEQFAREHHGAASCAICSKLESELAELRPDEAAEFLDDLGVTDSGVSQLITATYDLLGLASFLTAGEKAARAWTFRKGMTAQECAGVIHTDFMRGFIKAEVVAYEDLAAAGSYAAAREAGKYRIEGREYRMKDGDVVLFRFNV